MTEEQDAHLLSGAYALHAVTPEEAAQLEAAMRESEELRNEVVGLTDTAVALGLSAPAMTPPPALRARLLAAIDDLPQDPGPAEDAVPEEEERPAELAPVPASAVRHRVPRRRRRRRLPVLLTSAVAVAALLFGGGVLVTRALLEPQAEYAQIVAAPDAQQAERPVTGGGTVQVSWSASEGRTAVVLNGVRVPEGRVLQLWSVRGTTVRSDGLYGPEGDGRYGIVGRAPVAGESLAVSIEPPSGSKQPTTTPIVVVPLQA